MFRQQILTAIIAALVGATIASVATSSAQQVPRPIAVDKLTTRELIILDDQRKPAARLSSSKDRTVLEIYDAGAVPALEIGVDRHAGGSFVRLLGQHGHVMAALNSLPPNGEATLYLGDERWENRIVLGALRSDTDYGTQSIDDWGLELNQPHSDNTLLSLMVAPYLRHYKATLRLTRESGEPWTIQ